MAVNTQNLGGELRSQGYKIGTYSYPNGLGISPDLQHYVTFFINVRGKSKFVKDNTYKTLSAQTSAANNSVRDKINPKGTGTSLVYGSAVIAGGAATIAAAGKLTGVSQQDKRLTNTAQQLGKAGATLLIGGVAGYLTGQGLGSTQVLQQDKTKRLEDVITLHMQEKPSVSYGINYQDKDLGILGGFLGSDSALSDSTESGRMGGLAQSLALQIAKIPSILPGLGSITDIVQLGAKVKTNPFREVFFEGIDYRKFNFRYKFMPNNQTEVDAVKGIIDKFKEHMHPETAAGGAFFLYPSEFEIAYYFDNSENPYFNKIAACALTDMQVDYGGDQFSSFSNGAPTEINLTLSFRELELITKETIKSRGY